MRLGMTGYLIQIRDTDANPSSMKRSYHAPKTRWHMTVKIIKSTSTSYVNGYVSSLYFVLTQAARIYLALDFHGRVRLINFIRKNVGTVSNAL